MPLLLLPNRALKKISKIGPESVKCQSVSKNCFLFPDDADMENCLNINGLRCMWERGLFSITVKEGRKCVDNLLDYCLQDLKGFI